MAFSQEYQDYYEDDECTVDVERLTLKDKPSQIDPAKSVIEVSPSAWGASFSPTLSGDESWSNNRADTFPWFKIRDNFAQRRRGAISKAEDPTQQRTNPLDCLFTPAETDSQPPTPKSATVEPHEQGEAYKESKNVDKTDESAGNRIPLQQEMKELLALRKISVEYTKLCKRVAKDHPNSSAQALAREGTDKLAAALTTWGWGESDMCSIEREATASLTERDARVQRKEHVDLLREALESLLSDLNKFSDILGSKDMPKSQLGERTFGRSNGMLYQQGREVDRGIILQALGDISNHWANA